VFVFVFFVFVFFCVDEGGERMPSLLSFELAARLKSQKTETGTKKAAPQSISPS